MTDERVTRPNAVTASPGQTFRADRFSIGLAVLGMVLACALGAVLLLPDGESSAAPASTAESTAPTTAETTASTTVQSSSSPATTSNGPPFSMPTTLNGIWGAVDEAASATFSDSALVALDTEFTGEGLSIRYSLTRPSAIGPTLGPTTPTGMVVEGIVELNGVQRPIRAVGSLLPTAEGLRISFPLEIDPIAYDLAGSPTTVTVELILLPA